MKGYMSTDWNKYTSAAGTRQRREIPEANAVLSMIVGEVREIQLSVNHDPKPHNRAHSLVYNVDSHRQKIKKQKIKRKLSRIAKWEIKL